MSNPLLISPDLLGRRCHIHESFIGGDPLSQEFMDDEGSIVAVRVSLQTDMLVASVRWDESGRVVDFPMHYLHVTANKRVGKSRKSPFDKFPASSAYINNLSKKPPLAEHLKKVKKPKKAAEPEKPKRGRPKKATKKKATKKKATKKKAAKTTKKKKK